MRAAPTLLARLVAREAGRLGARPVVLALLGLALLTLAAASVARAAQTARSFTDHLIKSSLSIAASPVKSKDEIHRRFRELVNDVFDLPGMAQSALGPAWNTAAKDQRSAYLAAFEDAVVRTYMEQLTRDRMLKLEPVGVRPSTGGRQLSAVRFSAPGAPERVWIFTLQPSGESWRVVDVNVNGVNPLMVERENFARILEVTHGDIAEVVRYIRKKTPR